MASLEARQVQVQTVINYGPPSTSVLVPVSYHASSHTLYKVYIQPTYKILLARMYLHISYGFHYFMVLLDILTYSLHWESDKWFQGMFSVEKVPLRVLFKAWYSPGLLILMFFISSEEMVSIIKIHRPYEKIRLSQQSYRAIQKQRHTLKNVKFNPYFPKNKGTFLINV